MKRRLPKVWVDARYRRKISGRLLREWAVIALDTLDMPQKAGLEIAVVGDDEIRDLNQQYRGLDEPTDVLSFPFTPLAAPAPFYGETAAQQPVDTAFAMPRSMGLPLGEIVIDLPYAERQAAEQAHSVHDELRLLLVHGILHLIGHDHYDAEEERVMQAATKTILDKIAQSADAAKEPGAQL